MSNNNHHEKWPSDELSKIAGADDLKIAPLREDGVTYGTPTWIWNVSVGGELYVRPYNGVRSRWYQSAVQQKAGRIHAAGMIREVLFEPVAGSINSQIDDAYRAKYKGSPYLAHMIGERSRSATIKIIRTAISLLFILSFMSLQTLAQNNKLVVRMAKLEIDSAQLDQYKAMLKEGVETAVRVEPGVLALYAVYDKRHPTHVTVFEVYADEAAYEAHLKTPHFLKYKTGTQGMVKSLELIEVSPIALATKLRE